MLKNGVLAHLIEQQPSLRILLLHNIDTVGMDLDPALLAWHVESGAAMTVEVIRRRLEDRGGGLARADGQLLLIEGLAMLREEEDEIKLSSHNSNTMWIDIDSLLSVFGLQRADLQNEARVAERVRALAARMPTYVTLEDVKKRWGQGQENILPVAQFEKL
jgi:UDP-N-acetylglucosamine pyrophosphorylase